MKNIPIEEMREILAPRKSQHDHTFYFDRLVEYKEALFSKRFAPFQVGDYIEIIEAPVINNEVAWGWTGCKHFLIKGAIGFVKNVDYVNNTYVADCTFESESYIRDYDKKVIPINDKHVFRLKEALIKHLPQGLSYDTCICGRRV